MNYLINIIKHPSKLSVRNIKYAYLQTFARLYSDRKFLEKLFPLRVGYKLNLDNPCTYNEKLQWLKLYDRRPEYTRMVDKAEAKMYVAGIIGDKYIIPTIAVYDKVEDVDYVKLPNQFVLKCTHDSGGIVICKDKSKLNMQEANKKLSMGLKNNYFFQNREWPYKNVKPRIIAEKYMVDESGTELKDYKFFCFDGKPQFFKIDYNRYTDHHANYYSIDGKMLPFDEVLCPRDNNAVIRIPDNFDQMVIIASKLSEGIPFVRVDLYNINGEIFFGEMTFYPASGMGLFNPKEWDYEIGNLIKIPLSK